jgi:inward rectifier potassium channel
MKREEFDPGLTQHFSGGLRRTINKDGTFNVHRKGLRLRDFNPYLYLIDTSWPRFLLIILIGFLLINTVFALAYVLVGFQHLHASDSGLSPVASAFFFSVHTLTTVGYGDIYPVGFVANLVSALEAATGLLLFAIATGLMYGRFSKPTARIVFSKSMVITPYQDGKAVQFRIANGRKNTLLEIEAKVLFMTVRNKDGELKRDYFDLPLERPKVYFLPLTWTIVHPIDSDSPLYGKTAEDLARLEAEFLILIKAFDNTFSQNVNARNSYRHDEIVWGAKFTPVFRVDPQGDLVLDIDRIDEMRQLQS